LNTPLLIYVVLSIYHNIVIQRDIYDWYRPHDGYSSTTDDSQSYTKTNWDGCDLVNVLPILLSIIVALQTSRVCFSQSTDTVIWRTLTITSRSHNNDCLSTVVMNIVDIIHRGNRACHIIIIRPYIYLPLL